METLSFDGMDEWDHVTLFSTDWKRSMPVWALIHLGKLRRHWPAITGPILEVVLYTRQGHFWNDNGYPGEWLDEAEYCLIRIVDNQGETQAVHMLRGTYE